MKVDYTIIHPHLKKVVSDQAKSSGIWQVMCRLLIVRKVKRLHNLYLILTTNLFAFYAFIINQEVPFRFGVYLFIFCDSWPGRHQQSRYQPGRQPIPLQCSSTDKMMVDQEVLEVLAPRLFLVSLQSPSDPEDNKIEAVSL